MIDEKLLSVINKLLQIKEILAPSSNIEKSLEKINNKEDSSFADIVRQSKEIVDKLYSHICDIKTTFYGEFVKENDSCESRNNSDNGDLSSSYKSCSDSAEQDSQSSNIADLENEKGANKDNQSQNSLNLSNVTEACDPDESTKLLGDTGNAKALEKQGDNSNIIEDSFIENNEDSDSSKDEIMNSAKQNGNADMSDIAKQEDCDAEKQNLPIKPLIKLVDISKLVDPSIANKKKGFSDTSVIVLNSSDEESDELSREPKKPTKNTDNKNMSKRKSKRSPSSSKSKSISDKENDKDASLENGTRKRQLRKRSTTVVVELDSTDSESDDEKNEEPKVNGTETKSSSEDESVKPKWLKKAENIFDVSSSSDEDLDAKKNENNTSSKNKVSSSSSDDDSKPDGKQKNKHTNSGSELESNAYSSNDSLSDKDKSPKKNKNKKKSMKSSGNNSQEGVQKKKHVGSRSEDESNANSSNESISNKKKKKKSLSSDEELKKSVKRRRTDPMKNVNLTDVEDSNSDNNASPDLERTNSRNKHTKTTKKQQKKDTGKTELSIPLARVPCEKLKEVYERNKEALEIKRLTNMATLKNKRSLAQKSSSSASGDNKKKFKKQDSDKSDGEVHTGTDTDIETNHSVPSIQENDSGTEAMAEVVQNDISAEDDQEKTPDCIDSDDSITKKKNQKEKPKKARSSKNESNKENKDDNESEESDKDNDKRKKKWKNDKLLTGKLSSSDSEAEFEKAGSRLKNRKAKDSSKKKKKRTKNVIDSDDSDKSEKSSGDEFQTKPKSSSSSSSSESEEDNEETNKPKPKRKRIRKTKESSSDDEDKSTRKQIRKVIGRDSLSETTKKAEADEKERKARILEKQKKYNQIFESRDVNATVDKLVLDFNEETEEELLKVDEKMVKKLKPHQATGIKFMWDACFETIERAKSTKGSGCILAHCMGLGKTLQVITLTHALLTNSEKTGIERVMVVCPVNTVLNWKSEYKKWLPNDEDFEVYELVSCKQNYERQYQVTDWFKTGGVLIIGYNMFRTISNPTNKRISKKMRNAFCEGLVDPGPDLVICDEGHLLKNEKTNLSIAMNRVKTQRRIVLTGTPLQNNLKEYWCMVQFVKPNLLGTYKEYLNRFVNPIINGQYTDSTLHDIQVMRKRAHVLHKMLDGVVQRKDYAVLEPYLPPKHEYVLFISLTDVQIKLYEYYMQNLTKRNDGGKGTSFIFTDFQQLQRISTHPRVLLDKSIEDKEKKDKLDDEESEGSIKDFIDDGSDEKSSKASNSNSDSSSDDDSEKGASTTRTTRLTRALRRENNDPDSENEELEKEWWQEFCDGDELDNLNNSGKMFLLFEILKECEQIGDKILIFSQSLYTLNCIEYFLNKIDEATQAGKTDLVGGHSGSWSLGLDYFRLDGSSSCDNRASWCDQFNNPSNIRARLFLISTKAGGLGINLTAANRVIIFDVSWNPSHDIQSIYRVYRFGQKKPSYVYRFVAYGTMEMKIYERQVTKQAISKRVIDEQQIDRHYNQNDLQELYKCDLHPSERPIPLVPKDVLLGEMLHTYDKYIYKYHEHQSLLENKEEECLNEEERKAAWEEFENEKVNRYNYNTPNNAGYSTHTIAAALTNIVRRDNPLWTDMQIKAVIPALLQQLQVQVQGGDMSMYIRVQQEIKLMQAQNAQKIREQFYQQQVLRMIQQQQQQQNLMGNLQIDPSNLSSLLNSGSNGTSSNEVIELN